jgi:hypothetical protein
MQQSWASPIHSLAQATTADTTKTTAIEQRPESNVSSCTSKRAKGNTAATTTSTAPVAGKDGRLSCLLAGYGDSRNAARLPGYRIF